MPRKKSVKYGRRIHVNLTQRQSELAITTDKDDINLPAVIVFSGARGSGKTYSCIMLMRHFELKRYVTRTFLLCPTRHSNDLYSNLKTLHPKDSFEDENNFNVALHYVLTEVTHDWEIYRQEKAYFAVYQKWLKHPHTLTLSEQAILERRNGQRPLPIPKPSHLLVVDDAQGTGLYSNARKDLLTHTVIEHRHIPITIALLAQSWTGIPRVIRLNTTQFAVYKTGDKTQLKQIYDTFANTIEYEEFERMYQQAVQPPHGFLFIDTVPKKDYKRFRSGFNDYLIPSENKNS
jgi:hypothetical protein